MPPHKDNLDNFSRVGFNKNSEINGLDRFTKNLEKHFFSEVRVRKYPPTDNSVNLVIELDCNLGLLGVLHHLEKNSWGNFACPTYSFAGALNQLRDCNNVEIDVEEFSLFLLDTSIIVSKIYGQSIPGQLKNIFAKIREHAPHITRGLTEMPYEIYVPVFEDNVMEDEHAILMKIKSDNKNAWDYFGFWALYFYSENDALVYDLKNKLVVQGNLQMLNR